MSSDALPPEQVSPSPSLSDGLWQGCVELLAQELPEQLFATWIKPLQAQVSDDLSRVTITVANRFKLDWIRAQYAARMAVLLQQLSGQPVQVELVIAQKEAPSKPLFNAFQSEPDEMGMSSPPPKILRHRRRKPASTRP